MPSAIGTLAGNATGPRFRQRVREELMLLIALALTGAATLLTSFVLDKYTAALAAGVVGFGAALARLGFDATVQRQAPDANQGRAFAQFETRFQLGWVLAAFLPVALPIPGPLGFFLVGVVALTGAAWYLMGMRMVRAKGVVPSSITRRARRELRRRLARGHRPEPPPAGSAPIPPEG